MAGAGETAEGEVAAAGSTIAQNIRDGCDVKEPPNCGKCCLITWLR